MREKKLCGAFLLSREAFENIYGDEVSKAIRERVNILDLPVDYLTARKQGDNPLADVELIFGGWGTPKLDGPMLAAMPKLKVVFYGAGSVKKIVSEEFWSRGIMITSMASLNAISVAEYSLGVIILSLKHFWKYSCAMQREPQYRYRDDKMPGGYRSTVGLIGLGEIGKHVARLLHHLDILVLAHDPYCHEKEAAELGVKLVSFNDIFSRSDVVSLHIPLLAETKGIVRGEHFSLMRDGASFINTSRGAIVHEVEMIEVLKKRSDITAVLDVTWPEPPETGSALFNLHNVILTPHLAGAVGRECRRLGDGILSELYRHLSGQKLMYAVTRAKVEAGT